MRTFELGKQQYILIQKPQIENLMPDSDSETRDPENPKSHVLNDKTQIEKWMPNSHSGVEKHTKMTFSEK